MGNQSVKIRNNLNMIFKHLDTDHTGYLDKSGVFKMLKVVEISLHDPNFHASLELVDKFFLAVDKRRKNKISFEDLYLAIKSFRSQRR